ncbi:MAG: AAA family ATPase [Gallionella sp.]
MSKLTALKLENFTAFEKLEVNFSPGINVLIGTNGTGKTHLLKLLYSSCSITEDSEATLSTKLIRNFRPFEDRIGRLIRRTGKSSTAKIAITREGGLKFSASFTNHTKDKLKINIVNRSAWLASKVITVFIPVKEMLAHAPGFRSLYAKREVSFEGVYADIVDLAYLPKLSGPIDKDRTRLLNALQKAIEGKVVAKGEHFFLKNKQGDLEFTLLAEGMRKLALIWLLIQNGTLLSGTILFWDEPEANLNPSLMGEVVEVILELQRLGVQVFLTTHNYVLLKEFDLRKKKGDEIRYVSLFRENSGAVLANSSDDYSGIDPNAIAGTFSDLYDRELKRSLGV